MRPCAAIAKDQPCEHHRDVEPPSQLTCFQRTSGTRKKVLLSKLNKTKHERDLSPTPHDCLPPGAKFARNIRAIPTAAPPPRSPAPPAPQAQPKQSPPQPE
jgi:hypothetical protein